MSTSPIGLYVETPAMIGQPESGGAPIGPSAVEELVEAALTGAVAVLLWAGLRRMVGAAAPLLWRRAHQLVSGRAGRTPREPSGPASASTFAAAVVSPPPAPAVMCSVAGVRGPAGLSPEAVVPEVTSEGRQGRDDNHVSGMAAFETTSSSCGDGIIVTSGDQDDVKSDAIRCARVPMSEVIEKDEGDSLKAPCRTEDVSSDAAPGEGCEVPDTTEGMSDVSDEGSPCNQTFYSEGDSEDADAETDENTYDLEVTKQEQDDEYDDWFAVSNDDEIRTSECEYKCLFSTHTWFTLATDCFPILIFGAEACMCRFLTGLMALRLWNESKSAIIFSHH